MDDSNKTKPQLLNELAILRQQVMELHDPDTAHERIEGAPYAAGLDAESIMAAVREPLLVLDGNSRIISANRAFYQTFQVTAEERSGAWEKWIFTRCMHSSLQREKGNNLDDACRT